VTCRVLGFSKQAFYKWRANPVTQRDWDDAHLINAARDIHADDPAFGYRFIADELTDQGHTTGENRVARLCSQERIWSIHAKKRGLNRKAGPPVHDDHVKRIFTAPAPNLVWLTDIQRCFHPRVDHSNRIVGYSMSPAAGARSAIALRSADTAALPVRDQGRVVHSDRGSQFRSRKFVRVLKAHQLRGSMGRVGACGANAAMKSFFALLQKNVLDRQRWTSRHQLRLAVVSWIETTYHRRRRQRRLGKLTPIEFETIQPVAHAA
jgi:putative transposase